MQTERLQNKYPDLELSVRQRESEGKTNGISRI